MLYPLSYEGIVPICRYFSLRWPRKGYHKLLIGCQNCGKLAGLARVVVLRVRPEEIDDG